MEVALDAMADGAAAQFMIELPPAFRVALEGGGQRGLRNRRRHCTADGREIGQQRQNVFVGERFLRERIHGGAQMPMADTFESLLVGGEGERRGLPQVGRGRIEARNVVADVLPQVRRQLPLVSIDPMTSRAEALAVEDRTALLRLPQPIA